MKGSVLILVAALSAAAQSPQPRVALRDLTAEALKNNPEVVSAQKKYEAGRQRPTQESSLPDPMVSFGYASSGNPLPGAGLGREPVANIGVMASQEIPFPGKLKLKGEMASKEAEASFQEYQGVQLNVISRLKQAYYRLQYAYAATDVLKSNRELLEKFEKITEERYSVGLAALQDVAKAQAQTSILEIRIVKLDQERRSREAELNALLNRPAGSPVGRPEDLNPKQSAATLDELFASARRNSPMLGRDQKMIERSQLGVNMARKEYYPDFTLNAGYYNMGSMPPMYEIRADVKIPLYFWRKQRAAVNESVSSLSQARRSYEATDQTLRARIQDDYAMAQASAKLMKLYKQTVAPQADLALESSVNTYQTGTGDSLSVLMNFGVVLDYGMNYLDEALNYSLALARLEEMTGQSLTD